MTAQERKSIFAFCHELGIGDDDRHALIYGVTGKESMTELTAAETKAVLHELMERMKIKNRPELPRRKKEPAPAVAGMMTAAERMSGAIKKELGITTVPGKDIFRWVSFDNGAKLIEQLKRYVRSAEKRAERRQTG